MPAYDVFAPFYDSFMGNRAQEAAYIAGLVEEARPDARTLLEVACGTGALLAHFAGRYDVSGIDLSPKMLAIAKRKVPRARLSLADMTTFSLDERFDAVVCAYDSINHLLDFADWEAVFDRVHEHLHDRGVFVFDVNTERKLRRFEASPTPWTMWSGEDMLVIEVVGGDDGVTLWRLRIFEHVRGSTYRLHNEEIRELAFPAERIKRAVDKRFRRVSVRDPERARPSSRSERLYFVCRK